MKKILLFLLVLAAIGAGVFLYKKDIVVKVQEKTKQLADDNTNSMIAGYERFRKKYAEGEESLMRELAQGQNPEYMMVACSDSRVDPALLLQTDPGDIFMVRNVANIVPPYEKDNSHHGTSSALEYGVRFLQVKNLIILGHSQCGGVQAAMECGESKKNDFIDSWVSLIKLNADIPCNNADEYAKLALKNSYQNCMTFPWIKERVDNNELAIHLWFFDIKIGQIFAYDKASDTFKLLDE